MKRTIQTILMAAVLAAPALTFAQGSNGPVTRAQVKAELVQIENAGYHPQQKGLHYPDDIQAAEARLQAQSNMAYGGAVNTTTDSSTMSSTHAD